MTPTDKRKLIRGFVRDTFGLRGTFRLHRLAFGADLLRAPLNVVLAPVMLLVRLAGLLAKLFRCHRLAHWLSSRQILLETRVSRRVGALVLGLVDDMRNSGGNIAVPDAILAREVADYTGTRSAVAEITTTIIVMAAGFMMFHTATPGLVSLAGPVAEMRAQAAAIEDFPMGEGLGKLYYGVFSTRLAGWQVVVTGVVLAMAASVVTTFAGMIADPVQVLTGTHQRRLHRLLTRLEQQDAHPASLPSEHITARLADISDIILNLWRALRG